MNHNMEEFDKSFGGLAMSRISPEMKNWTKLNHIQHSVHFDISASLFLTTTVASWVGFRRYIGVNKDNSSA